MNNKGLVTAVSVFLLTVIGLLGIFSPNEGNQAFAQGECVEGFRCFDASECGGLPNQCIEGECVCNGSGSGSVCGNGTVEHKEECDDGNIVGGDGCNSECIAELETGSCTYDLTTIEPDFLISNVYYGGTGLMNILDLPGSESTGVYFMWNEGGDLENDLRELHPQTDVTWGGDDIPINILLTGMANGGMRLEIMTFTWSDGERIYDDPVLYQFTQSCGPVCGDGVLDEGEVCDLGTGNGTNAGCTSSCTLNLPTCTLDSSTYVSYVGSGIAYVVSGVQQSYTSISNCVISYGDGTTGSHIGTGWGGGHVYQNTGVYLPSVECTYTIDGSTGSHTVACDNPAAIKVYNEGADQACVEIFANVAHSYCYNREYGMPAPGVIREFLSGGATFFEFSGDIYNSFQPQNFLLEMGATGISYNMTVVSSTGAALSVTSGLVSPTYEANREFTLVDTGVFPITISSIVNFWYSGLYYEMEGSEVFGSDRYNQDCEATGVTWQPMYCQMLTSDGVCGPSAGQTYSDVPSSGLCTNGNASAVVVGTTGYEWSCMGTYDGMTVDCSAGREPYCGDAVVDEGEDCDDGDTISGDGCSETCEFEVPSCTVEASAPVFASSGVIFSGAVQQNRAEFQSLSFGYGSGVSISGTGSFEYMYTGYTVPGVYTATVLVVNGLEGASAVTASCEVSVEVSEDPQNPLPEFDKIAEIDQSGGITIIHYTVTAYIGSGETQATIYDGLSQGGEFASINTGSISIAPHSSNSGAQFTLQSVEGYVNEFDNVWAYLATVSGAGNTWFTISYDVIPTTGGMVCNLCQLFTGSEIPGSGGGTSAFFLAPEVYAQGLPVEYTEICSFVPTFTKTVVSTTETTVTYRIDGTITTGGVPFTITDDFDGLTQHGALVYGPTGLPGLSFIQVAGGTSGSTSFTLEITNTTAQVQSYFITFSVNLPLTGALCNQGEVTRTSVYGSTLSINEYVSDDPNLEGATNDATCACPVGQVYENGDCREDLACDGSTLPSLGSGVVIPNDTIVVCNNTATGVNQPYVYDDTCTAGCAYTCADDHVRVGDECVEACDATTLPENMSGVEICTNGLVPPSQTGYNYVTGGCVNAASVLCPFSCSEGYSWNGSECILNTCEGTLPDHASFCNSPQIPETDGEPITFNDDCVSPFPPEACHFECDPGYVRDGDECIGTDYMSKTAVLSGSTISYTIQGTLTIFSPETFTLEDTLSGQAVMNEDVVFSGIDGVTAGTVVYTPGSGGFSIDITRDNDGGIFTITFTAQALRGGNENVCNEALALSGESTIFLYSDNLDTNSPDDSSESDPTCVSGYDLEMIKYVQPTWSESDVYPENIAEGIVYDGDWYIYHVEVVNNGVGDAYDVHVDDQFPLGVVGYHSDNVPDGVVFTPSLIDGALSFIWDIERLNVGESRSFDVWVTFDNDVAGLDEGNGFCNVAEVSGSGENEPLNNTDASSSNDDACLTLGVCNENRVCEGEIYATGFVWTVSGDTQNGTIRVDATCVVEASCDDSETFAADPAELIYGQTDFSLALGEEHTITIPSDMDSGTTGVDVDLSSVISDNACEYITEIIGEQDRRTISPQDFQNYTITNCSSDGTDVTFTLQHRTWKHRLTCRKEPLNACSTPYAMMTYEITPPDWTSLEEVAEEQALTQTPHGEYVAWRPEVEVNIHTRSNSGCNLCGNDGGPEYCGEQICSQCPVGTYAYFTNQGGTGGVTLSCLCESTGEPQVNDECPGMPSSSKTVTISGDTLIYTLSGLHIPTGQPSVIVTDEISGNVQLLNGSVQLLGGGVTLAGVNMTATTLEAYITRTGGGVGTGPVYFGMTYQAESLGTGSSQICNQAFVSTGLGNIPFQTTDDPGTFSGNDATCICPPETESCDGQCVSVGDCNETPTGTGTVQKTAIVSGDIISYTVTVTMPSGGSVSVTDVLTGGAEYDNNFSGTATVGSGEFVREPEPAITEVTFIVTNNLDTSLVYVITYTATLSGDAGTDGNPGICNAINIYSIDGTGTVIGTDNDETNDVEICVCVEGYELCEGICVVNGTCNPQQVTGDVQKTATLSGDMIVYEVTVTIPQTGIVTITDELSGGAVYANDFTGESVNGNGIFSWDPEEATTNVTFTIINTGPGALVYRITYSAQTTSGRGEDLPPVCNAVQMSGTDTIVTECSCPVDTELCEGICVANGTCNPPQVTGDVQKTATLSGDMIVYEVTVTIPQTGIVTITDELSGGAVYANDFTGESVSGNGIFSWDPEEATTNVTFTIINTGPGALIYRITYSAQTTSGRGEDLPPVCNAVQMSGTDTIVTECSCPVDTELCEGICVANGTCNPPQVTGDVQKTATLSGDMIVYEVTVTMPQTGIVTITDELSGGAVYANDFTGESVSGNGIFSREHDEATTNVTFTIINTGPGALVYRITYSAQTTSGWGENLPPVCNAVQISGTDTIVTECSCPVDTELCEGICVANGTCNPPESNTGDITIEKIVNVTGAFLGDPISYSIVITNIGTSTVTGGIIVTDTPPVYVEGSFTPPADVVSGGTYIWNSLPVLSGGDSYTITFSGEIACQGSGCPSVGTEICNVASVSFGFGSGQNTDSACTTIIECTDDSDCPGYCDDGVCRADAICSDLSVQPITGSAPLTSTYECIGSGTAYMVRVMNASGQVIASGTSATGSFNFGQNGIYTIQCAIDNDVGAQCNDIPVGVAGAQWLLSAYATQLQAANILSGNAVINRSDLMTDTSLTPYLNTTTSVIAEQLGDDAVVYMIQQLVSQVDTSTGITYGDGQPVITVPPLTQAILAINTIAQQLVADSCQEVCEETVTVTSGGGGPTTGQDSCQDLVTPDATTVTSNTHTVRFTCESTTGYVGELMQIACDSTNVSGAVFTGYAELSGNKAVFTTVCTYTGYNAYRARCTVAGEVDTNNSCEELVLLKIPGGGNGDGTTTDGGTNGGGSNGGSNGGGSNGGGSNGGGGGGGSPLTSSHTRGKEPTCAYIDPPSVHVDEYLPYRWDLELSSSFNYTTSHSCSNASAGTILKNDMICHFSLYNGKSGSPITRFTEPCFGSDWDSNPLFKDSYFQDASIQSAMGKSYFKLSKDLVGNTLGEYQLTLDRITYSYCDGGSVKQTSYEGRICGMNFAVADGYLMHQGVGLSTTEDTDLSKFKNIAGDPIIPVQTLRSLTRLTQAVPNSSARDYLMEKVVNDTMTRATVNTDRIGTTNILSNKLKKVASREIYVVDGNFTIRNVTSQKDQPFTLIVRNGTLTVEGSVDTNAMFIVPEGKIVFENIDCDERDVVKGIYMTRSGFGTNKVRNDNLGSSDRCTQGGLVVEGMLVGPDVSDESFVDGRRASLQDWFDLNDTTQTEKIFDGASVLVKTNPSLWRNLPPAANEFMERLNIRK